MYYKSNFPTSNDNKTKTVKSLKIKKLVGRGSLF